MDIQARITEWTDCTDIRLSEEDSQELFWIMEKLRDDAESKGYDEGFDEGKIDARSKAEDEAQQTIDEYADQIETALQLIDADRAAAKVYLDRAYNGLSFAIPKQGETPCLL